MEFFDLKEFGVRSLKKKTKKIKKTKQALILLNLSRFTTLNAVLTS